VGEDGSVEVELSVTSPEALRSYVLGFLEHAEVIAPPELRADIVAWLQAVADAEGTP
jgi:predicted DNA-binding transcriptional regulator YafY